MKNLETVMTDATCYESWLRYPTDAKLLWECCEKAYKVMCEISAILGEHRMRTKYNDVEKARMAYVKKRKYTHQHTRAIKRRMLSFNAFNEGTELEHCASLSQRLFGVKVKKIGGDQIYAGNDNRTFCRENGIMTPFVKKGRMSKDEAKNESRRTLAKVRATAMEGSFGTQKNHYGLDRMVARLKSTKILLIFFGIHTANAVLLVRREAKLAKSQAKAA